MSLKFVRYIAWASVVAVTCFVGTASVLWYQKQPQSQAAAVASIGGDFSLVTTDGVAVNEATYLGKPRAMFFGFTHCPEVCPTTLYEASNWMKALGDDAEKLSFLFVSVDPERDNPEVLKEYMSAFEGGIVGLTGDPGDVSAMVKAYRVYVRKVELEDGDYTVDHTAAVYLMDKNGDFVGSINFNEDQDSAVKKLRNLVGAS